MHLFVCIVRVVFICEVSRGSRISRLGSMVKLGILGMPSVHQEPMQIPMLLLGVICQKGNLELV